MNQFQTVMNNVNQLLQKGVNITGRIIGNQPILSTSNSPTLSQVANTATGGKQGLGNKFLQGNMTGSDMLNAILGAVNPEDDAINEFTHNLGALTGDVTRQFQPQEIQSAIQQLKGQPLTGQYYQDNAIKLANYLHAKSSGAVINSPLGGQNGL